MLKEFSVEGSMLVFAMRYAMGRQTFAPSIVVENIKHNISRLDNKDIIVMIRDIEEHGDIHSYGMQCDKNLWLGFKEYLEEVLEYRRSPRE